MDAANSKPEPVDDADDEVSPHVADHLRALRDDPGREARWAKWQAENAGAIAASNAWYEKNGHPLAAYIIKPGDPLPR